MLLDGEVLPLGLHLLIGFQHGPGFGPADAHFEAALHDLVNDHCVDALALQVGPHGNQQQSRHSRPQAKRGVQRSEQQTER